MWRRRLLRAIGPALVGMVAAHQVAYLGHDDGHLHSHLSISVPIALFGALLLWLATRSSGRARFTDVVALQAVCFLGLETVERLHAGFALADAAPIAAALIVMPFLAWGLLVLDRVTALLLASSHLDLVSGPSGLVPLARFRETGFHRRATLPIRAPPCAVM